MSKSIWTLVAGFALGVATSTVLFMVITRARPMGATPEASLTSEQKLEIFKKVKQTAVVVRAYFNGTVSYGSGVVVMIDKGRIVAATNAHVIRQGTDVSTRVEVKPYGSKSFRPARVLKWVYDEKEQLDLAYLLFTESRPTEIEAQIAPPDETIKPGQWVLAIGNPRGEEFFEDDGSVSEVRTKGAIKLIIHNAITEHGSSGGGLFDQHGHLIGINTWLLGNDLGVAAEINSLMHAHQVHDEANK